MSPRWRYFSGGVGGFCVTGGRGGGRSYLLHGSCLRPQLDRQTRERRLDQEPRLRVPPHLPIQMKQRVQHARQAPRGRMVALSERRHQPVPAPFHQPTNHLPELRARRVDPAQLGQSLRGSARKHVVEQRVQQPRIRNSEECPRGL